MSLPATRERKIPFRWPLFVRELLADPLRNAKQAAIRAGYKEASAHITGSALLKNEWIAAEIAKADEPRLRDLEVTADRVIREIAALGFADMGDYLDFDKQGGVKLNLGKIPKGATKAIMEVTQETVSNGKGENAIPRTITKFKLHPKTPALELLARYLGILVQKHEHSGPDGGPIPVDGNVRVYFEIPDNGRNPIPTAPEHHAVTLLTAGTPG